MSHMIIMELFLLHEGIGPTADKVKAIVDEKESQNASEVSSFLGMANYLILPLWQNPCAD